ncbi:hypothetical protein [Corynebacterium lizhenjunii]|uniref:hypothetical protein n=1 Tax=Corynebacterium lizhenjunii TaxID=2709394 RepID=UPI0013ED7978|nr:hypothetical protein [Corynebacterium lizhenjunii]
MPIIQFCVLAPDEQASRVQEVFSTAVNKLVDSGQLGSARVELEANPALPDGVDEQLRQVYRDEHEDRDLEFASIYRYDISVAGVQGSVNQLAMVLSRLLTPHAALPKDHVLLEDERAHERPAIYPWTLDIVR